MPNKRLTPISIGQYIIDTPVIAAPMAGVSDKPYRQVCRNNGAGLVVSEMVTSQLDLTLSTKSKYRLDLNDEPEPVVVQLVGTDPNQLAQAAQFNVANGAQIIDINMGCPAKKVCKKAAGSALLENEPLVRDILKAVVSSVDVPVSLKIRTGTNPSKRNGVTIAKIAEDAGIKLLTVHGRTRECKFIGEVEYNTINEIKQAVTIPIIANGDINTPHKAQKVLNFTGADGVMIGRAAQGQPWLFQQVADFLTSAIVSQPPSAAEKSQLILDHIKSIHHFYAEHLGVRFARKHIKCYLQYWHLPVANNDLQAILRTESTHEQLDLLSQFLTKSLLQVAA